MEIAIELTIGPEARGWARARELRPLAGTRGESR